MQSNQSKQPTGKIWAKQIPTTQISNLRNNKEHLRKKTKRKTIKQQLMPVRINIFIQRPAIKPTGHLFWIPQND